MTETLVKPRSAVSPLASAVHHLVGEDLESAPGIEDVITRFAGADAYVAHNCSFEKGFLRRYRGQQVWICTYKCALRVWPEFETHNNQALRYQLGLVNPLGLDRAKLIPHRAEPTLMTVLDFGKHRGQRFDAVPRDYLRWMVEAPNSLSETAKFSARYWLNQLGA
jgi:exodeoxyribonuclease X